MNDDERRQHMRQVRRAASYLNGFDIDEFGDDAEMHPERAIRWALDEIERLDRLNAIFRCRLGADPADDGRWDDLECEHDHTRSVLADEPPRGRGYDGRVKLMRQSWPSASTFETRYTILGDNTDA